VQIGISAVPATADVASPAVPQTARTAARNGGLDALRAVMTLLVLFHHTAITYGAGGGWFYHELRPDGSSSSNLLTTFVAVNQAYFMGLFFLLAGYFTPAAIRSRGAVRYARERLVRLGLPLFAFGLLLGPITVALAAAGRGRPFVETLLSIWRDGRFIQGPLWFAEALLIFAAAALIWYTLSDRTKAVPDRRAGAPFPTNATLAIAALITGATAFVIRLWWPVGTEWHGLQLGYFAGYTTLFIAGCAAADSHWLERVPKHTARLWRLIAPSCAPILPAALLLAPTLHGSSDGGWTVPALIYALWEPLLAWGIIMTLLIVFQRRFQQLTPRWRQLAERAYTIYIIHPPVLVAVALALRTIAAPALLKFAATGIATCAICFVLAGLILRIPGARRVL
jgi:peptidoglycan/LPS O-acetylase OafA/YrhL